MTIDLSKFIKHSSYASFMNLGRYIGSITISGTVTEGVNTRTTSIALPQAPRIADILFYGRGQVGFSVTDYSTDNRLTNTWFDFGYIYVRGDGTSYTNYPTNWLMSAYISGSDIIVRASYQQQFAGTLTLTSEVAQVRLVDYVST